MLRINAIFPLDGDESQDARHWQVFSVMSTLEGATFFSWLWLFSFKYYTVSREIKFMFHAERQGSEVSRRRKTLYRIAELSNLILLGITTLALLFIGTVGYGDEGLEGL